MSLVSYPGHPESVPDDFEDRCIEFARKILDDVPCCREASYGVRWIGGLPLLVLAFDSAVSGYNTPALGIGLVKVNNGTLLQAYPGHELFRGEKLRTHILSAVEQYLNKLGAGLGLRVTA